MDGAYRSSSYEPKNPSALISLLSLATAVMGIAFGYFFPAEAGRLTPLATLFTNALTMLAAPLVLVGIIAAFATLGDKSRIKALLRAIGWFTLAASAIGAMLGVALGLIFTPGVGAFFGAPSSTAASGSVNQIFDGLLRLIERFAPQNIGAALLGNDLIAILLFAGLLGLAFRALRFRATTAVEFSRALFNALVKIVGYVMFVAPLGVFALTATVVAEHSSDLAQLTTALSAFSLVYLLGACVQIALLFVIYRLITGQNPLPFAAKMSAPAIVGLASGSTVATVPVVASAALTYGLDSRAVGVAVPFGATLKSDLGALFIPLAALFVFQGHGMTPDILTILLLIPLAIVGSFIAGAFPQGNAVMAALTLGAVGASDEMIRVGITAIMALDWLTSRVGTGAQAYSDSIMTAIASKAVQSSGGAPRPRGRYSRPSATATTGESYPSSARPSYERRPQGDGGSRGRDSRYADRGDRGERSERPERADRSERSDRGDRGERSERPEQRTDRGERGERSDRPERSSRYGDQRRGERNDRGGRYDQGRRPSRGPRRPYEGQEGSRPDAFGTTSPIPNDETFVPEPHLNDSFEETRDTAQNYERHDEPQAESFAAGGFSLASEPAEDMERHTPRDRDPEIKSTPWGLSKTEEKFSDLAPSATPPANDTSADDASGSEGGFGRGRRRKPQG